MMIGWQAQMDSPDHEVHLDWMAWVDGREIEGTLDLQVQGVKMVETDLQVDQVYQFIWHKDKGQS